MPASEAVVALSNGVEMPSVLLGTGSQTWNDAEKTRALVELGLKAGFKGIDTANHYRNHDGVRRGIAAARAAGHVAPGQDVWITTKMEPCGNSIDPRSPILKGTCYEDTLKVFDDSLKELGVAKVDLTLIHGPPCVPGASWHEGCIGAPGQDLVYPLRCNCAAAQPCKMMQAQWKALEEAYTSGRTRAIGVSNYCPACLACIAQTATISPHINQFKLHTGMRGADPGGIVSATHQHGARVQAYRPLGQGSLLGDATLKRIGRTHGKSSAQVALKWVLQQGHTVVTSANSEAHLRADLELFGWSLAPAEMRTLNQLVTDEDDPPSIMCQL